MDRPVSFGKYFLLDRINVGGMAEVYKAKTFGIEGFERILAIKRILPNMAEDQEFINMFVDEARIAVQLNHPNIVQIFELGKFQDQYYIAMEYVSGKDLRQVLGMLRKQEKPLPQQVASYVVSQLALGLDYAHNTTDATGKPLKVIHRDISPQNILLGYNGHVKLTDFGIAKADDRLSRTQVGVLKGKFAYMSPEQVRGMEIDYRSDIFALGILFYELLTGQRLFLGESDFSTLEKVRNVTIPAPREVNADIPEELEAILLKLLAKEREDRFQRGHEVVEALKPFLEDAAESFTQSQFAEFMKEQFAEAMEAERQKMEIYQAMDPPSNEEVEQGLQQMDEALRQTEEHGGAMPDMETEEKTVIFETGFGHLPEEPTRVGLIVPPAVQRPVMQAASPPVESSGWWPQLRQRYQSNRAAFILGGSAALAVLIILMAVLWPTSKGHGSLEITSQPSTNLQILLDNKLIGTSTPLRVDQIDAGDHVIVARAAGYRQQMFRFFVEAGLRTPIEFTLQPTGTGVVAAGSGVLEVVTQPPMASVYIDGIARGVSPVTIKDINTGKAVALQVRRQGYVPQVMTVNFAKGETQKRVNVVLMPRASGGQQPMRVLDSGEGGKGTVIVTSDPSGAMVRLDSVDVGQTPLQIDALLISKQHEIVLSKDGFQRVNKPVRFLSNGVTQVSVHVKLRNVSGKGAASGSGSQQPVSAGPCKPTGGLLSVMPVGGINCSVMVGNKNLGIAPFFRKQSPSGGCRVRISCSGGKHLKKMMNIVPGRDNKLIIQGSDWQQ